MVERGDGPRVYVVVQGTVFVKENEDPRSGTIWKATRKVGTRLFCTGKTWTGPQGGLWAELDFGQAPQNGATGWMLVEGPGFGVQGPLLAPDSRLVNVEVKGGPRHDTIAECLLPASVTVRQLKAMLAARTGLKQRYIKLTQTWEPGVMGSGYPGVEAPRQPSAPDMLSDARLLSECDVSSPLNLVYVGHFKQDYQPQSVPGTKAAEEAEQSDCADAAETGGAPTAPPSYFKVLEDFVSVRGTPSIAAPRRGALALGDVVFGSPYKIDGVPWLRIGKAERPSWVLIHGGCMGMGQLLEVLHDRAPPPVESESTTEKRQSTASTGFFSKLVTSEPPPAQELPSYAPIPQASALLAEIDKAEAEVPAFREVREDVVEVLPPPAQPPVPTAAAATKPQAWTTAQVVQFVESLGLSDASKDFEENAVDGRLLGTLSEEELISELGLKKLQARKVLLHFKEACSAVSSG